MTRPLSFGLIGASRIAVEALLEPLSRRADARVVHVAARRPGAAEAFARDWELRRASVAYDDVLADDDVDAVYVSNAAVDHARWAIAALEHGKHVLCEKPIAVDEREALTIAAAAVSARRVVMEGFHYRFHPLFRLLLGIVSSGTFGRLLSSSSVIAGVRPYDPNSILHAASLGGGALFHNGVYGAHWSRLLFDSEPVSVSARSQLNPSGADAQTSAELRFGDGGVAHVECSFVTNAPVSVTLEFERAVVAATGVIGPHHGHSLRIGPAAGPSRVRTVAGRSSFDYQLAEFVRRCAAAGAAGGAIAGAASSPGRGDDIAANMRVIDAIRRAATSGVPEMIGR
ncbi:Gfo/Idh/MocA family protein [Gryllotalpicola reticulitermitis]|uniref:Gfo/Idh/MocA family protein n=1 Tax=Gryllotalpicola reticulitermitis TaxID=1184153 RepID=A0ABV8QA97_9MICO